MFLSKQSFIVVILCLIAFAQLHSADSINFNSATPPPTTCNVNENRPAGCPCSSQTDCYGYCDNNSKLSPSYTCQNAIQPGGFCKGLEVNNECSGDYYCYLGSHTCQRCLGGGAFCTRDAECSTRNCIGSTQLFNGTYTTGQCSNPSDLGKAIATIVLIAIIVPCVIVFLCICIPLTIWCCRRSRVGPVISPVQQPLIYQVTSPNQPVFIAGQQPYQVLP